MNYKEEIKQSLLKKYPYKAELHAHTKPASPCANLFPEEVVERYNSLGFSAICITNHFANDLFEDRFKLFEKDAAVEHYLDDFHKAYEAGQKAGINVILGAEIRFPQNENDYLIFGIEEKDLYDVYDGVKTSSIEDFYKSFSCGDHIVIQAHPYRDDMICMPPETVDGYEGLNLHPTHNSRVGVAIKTANKAGKLMTAGTDFHDDGHQGMAAMRFQKLPNNSIELAHILKENDFIFDVWGSLMLP